MTTQPQPKKPRKKQKYDEFYQGKTALDLIYLVPAKEDQPIEAISLDGGNWIDVFFFSKETIRKTKTFIGEIR